MPEVDVCARCGLMIYLDDGVWLRVDREGDEVGDLCPVEGPVGEYHRHAVTM